MEISTTPKVGEIVTFSYEKNIRRDSPVNPRIYRIRNDLSWDDIVKDFHKEIKRGIYF